VRISRDKKFGNSFNVNKMAARIFVAIFKANKYTKLQEFINRIQLIKVVAVNIICF